MKKVISKYQNRKTRAGAVAATRHASAPGTGVLNAVCNYSDNYYGDQVCVAPAPAGGD